MGLLFYHIISQLRIVIGRTAYSANSSSTIQNISCILWKMKVHYHTYNSPISVLPLSQINSLMLSHSIILRYSLILSSHLRLDLPRRLFPSDFLTKTPHAYLFSPICSTLPAPLIPTKKYLVKGTNHEGNCNKTFSILLLFLSSETKISSLAHH
jgi:hypothetical protein